MSILCEEVQGESVDGDTALFFGGVPNDSVVFIVIPISYSMTKPTL